MVRLNFKIQFVDNKDILERKQTDLTVSIKLCNTFPFVNKESVTIVADFSPEFNPPFRWRSKHETKNHRAYQ